MTAMNPHRAALSRLNRMTAAVVGLLALGVGGWSVTASLGSAVVAPATVVVAGKAKVVQNREGGVIAEIRVREGDRVEAGALVMRLDDAQIRAEQDILTGQLYGLLSRQARLVAEQKGVAEMADPADPELQQADARLGPIISGERTQFQVRRHSREGQRRQLGERIAQIDEQREGRQHQLDARTRELVVVKREVEELRPLKVKGLVTAQRFNTLERTLFSLEGEIGNTRATIAQALAQIAEIRAQIDSIDREHMTEVAKDMRETEDKLVETRSKLVAVRDRLTKTEVRAPAAGIVHALTTTTVGGVAPANETLMQIVPLDARLMIEVKVDRADIDRVGDGQKVRVRFANFDRRTTPELDGTVVRIAADAETDRATNASYFKVDVTIPAGELAKLGGGLKPGMTAEAMIQTGERTAFDYFAKPVTDQLARAFTER